MIDIWYMIDNINDKCLACQKVGFLYKPTLQTVTFEPAVYCLKKPGWNVGKSVCLKNNNTVRERWWWYDDDNGVTS